MITVGLNPVETINRATWRKKTTAIPATPQEREKLGKKTMFGEIVALNANYELRKSSVMKLGSR